MIGVKNFGQRTTKKSKLFLTQINPISGVKTSDKEKKDKEEKSEQMIDGSLVGHFFLHTQLKWFGPRVFRQFCLFTPNHFGGMLSSYGRKKKSTYGISSFDISSYVKKKYSYRKKEGIFLWHFFVR
jgi:hypothetical protein